MEIGQLCVKLAGRDAGMECVVIENIDENFVLVDGNTRRRKCNIRHLELLGSILDVKESASHNDVIKAMKDAGVRVIEAKKGASKEGKKAAKPVKKRKALIKAEAEKAAKEKAKGNK